MKILMAILVMLNGKPVEFKDAKPFVEKNVLMVPLRGVFEAMGASIEYSATAGGVDIQKGENKIEIPIGKMNAYVNGKSVGLDFPALRQNNRVFVPLRFIAESLSAKVGWNNATRTASITTKTEAPSTPPPSIRAGEIEVKVSSDKTSYRAGEVVQFIITAINQDDQPRELNFRSGQSFDVTVTPANQNEALWRWDWSHDRMFTQALREQVLKPGETLTFNATWNQVDNDGKLMPRGEYSVQAKLTTEKPIESPASSLTLTD